MVLEAAVVKEQVGQGNDQKPVKRIEFHEYWTVPNVWK